ncbi:MAG: hypothetical protein Q8O14_12730 [bacterium]|nr:hypothetical protein [bacterium]
MSVLITRSTDCSVFGGYSMKIQAEGGPSATSLAKVNFIDLRGLSKVCVSAYIRMHLRNAGTFYARITPYYEDHMPMTPIDWTVLTQSGETQFTRYWRSFDMSKLGDAGELPLGTVFIKLSFGWDGALASGTAYVDAVKVEQGSFPTHWTPYGLKEQDSLDLVSDGETYRRVKEVNPSGEITPGSIQDGAVLQPKLADGAVGSTKIADGSVNLGTKVVGELPNANLARIDLPSKIADGILPETKLDSSAQGKLSALRSDGYVRGAVVQEDAGAPGGIRTLIDTSHGQVTTELKTSDGAVLDTAVRNAAALHARAIAEPYEDNSVPVGSIHAAGGGVFTYRLAFQAAGAAINIGETGDSLAGLFDLLNSAGGDLLDSGGAPVTVTGICLNQNGTSVVTPGDAQTGSGLGAGWWLNDGGAVPLSTVFIKLSALPVGTVTHFDALYSRRNTVGALGRNALVKKAVVSGEADPNLTATILDLKGTGDWNTPVAPGRKLIDLTDASANIAPAKVVQASIADGAVGAAKIAAGAVGAAQLAAGAVGSNQLGTNAVIDTKITAGAVTETKLADGAVTTNKLGAAAVTTAKVADAAIATAKLATNAVDSTRLAADTASLGKVTSNALQRQADGSIALGSGTPLIHLADGSTVVTSAGLIGAAKVAEGALQDAAVTGNKVAAGAVTGTKLADGSVSAAKIVDGSVGSSKIATGAVTSGKIAAGVVGSTELGASAVTNTKLADGAVTTAKLGAAAVGSSNLADAAVGTTKLADAVVTQAKMGSAAVGSAQLIDGAVSTAKIAAGAVATDRLADGAVSGTKLAANAVGSTHVSASAIGATQLATNAVTADKLAAGSVTREKVDAGVFSELSTVNLIINGSFETAAWI